MVTIKKTLVNVLFPLFFLLLPGCCQTEKVKALTITDVGMTLKSNQKKTMSEGCHKFRPTRGQIIYFFNQAQRVSATVVDKDRYTPCFAQGQLTWRNGTTASWTLYSSGTASLRWDNGEVIYLLDRHYHWYDPNECIYVLGDDGEC